MGQQTRVRKQQSIPLTSFGAKSVVQLGKGMQYREIMLRLSGALTFTLAAQNAAADIGRGDEWSLIQRIDLIANGADVIRSFSGSQLRMINRLVYGTVPRLSATLGDGTTAAPTFDSTLTIPLWMFQCIRPVDTLLDSSKLADLRLEITTNTAAGFSKNATPPTAVNATLDVHSYESFGLEGNFSDTRIYQIQDTVPAANAARQILLPTTALYRGFFINTAAGSADTSADAPSSLTNIKLQSGTQVFRDIPARVLRDWQRQRVGFAQELVQTTAGAAAVNGNKLACGKSTLLDEDAWLWFDLCQDGYLTEGIDTVGLSELVMELNIAAACTVTVIPVQVFPVRGAR